MIDIDPDSPEARHARRYDQLAQLAVVVVLVLGCLLILRPFLVAILFAVVVCLASWPAYQWLLARVRGHRTVAASLMALLLLVLVAGPVTMLAFSMADAVTTVTDWMRTRLESGPIELPAWVQGLPLVGAQIDAYWHKLAASREEVAALVRSGIEPARNFLLASARVIGDGVLQTVLAVFVAFFLYRDGDRIADQVQRVSRRLAGRISEDVLDTIQGTLVSVAYGMIGSAVAQGAVAMIGFVVAGVPSAFLLGALTFLLSIVPLGPVIIWGGAAFWLYDAGQTGWAIFMLLWGLLAISSVDNFVKPYLISRGSNMSLVVVIFGVFGGVFAFGFIGIFIGPALLAVGLGVLEQWLRRAPAAIALPGAGADDPARPD